MSKIKQFLTRRKKLLFVASIVVLLAIGAFVFYKMTIETPSVTSTPSTSQEQDQQAAQQGESQKNPASVQSNSQSDKQASGTTSSGAPASPQGNFVSSHRVGLSDSIESICATSSGASCQITFTRNGVVKSLDSNVVSSNGSVSWVWTPDSIGLSSGSWEIKAVASQNNLQTEAKDPRNLEVVL